jgi:small conductance mechanosensitive channel
MTSVLVEAPALEIFINELNRQFGFYAPRMLTGVVVFALFWAAGIAVSGVIRRVADRSQPGRRDVLGLLANASSVSLKGVGLITALGTMNINVSALVAGLGLTGFALGFALKDAISNLLAGCLILFYRPFRRHDRIIVTGLEGEVLETNLRYTALQADGRRYLIPNSTLLNNPIVVVEPKTSPPRETASIGAGASPR